MKTELVVQRADFWISAAIFQGARLVAHLDAQEAAGAPDTRTDEERERFNTANVLGDGHLVEDLEAHFFMVALHNARTFAEKLGSLARKHWPEFTGAVAQFEQATSHVDDQRDMWEHEDEYLSGRGKAQERYVRERPDPSGDGPPIVADAHTTILQGENYRPGDRVDVRAALKATRSLYEELERAKPALSKLP